MKDVYISIGSQCTTPTIFNILNVKKESLPFDWIFSTPEFVYTILRLLFVDKIEVSEIVDNHFLVQDGKAYCNEPDNFITDVNGTTLVNSKYKVCFPHYIDDARDVYIRRIERLKGLVLDSNNFVHFVYVSTSSPTKGNYTLDGVEPIQNLYEYICKINSLMKDLRTNYRIILFDTNKTSDITSSDISHIEINKKDKWIDLLPQLVQKFEMLLV